MEETQKRKPIAVIGLGNLFMGDDGIGIHILSRLREKADEIDDVDFIDAGSAPMKVLHTLVGRQCAVLIDCARMDEPPGTMKRFRPHDVVSRKKPAGLTIHEGDLLAILRISQQLGELPETTVIFAIEPAEVAPGEGLSPMIAERLEEHVTAILEEIALLRSHRG